MESIKFFKDSIGLWHVNNTIMAAGTLSLRQITDTEISLQWASTTGVNQNNNVIFKGDVTNIKKEDGTSYASISEFLTACAGFFVISGTDNSKLDELITAVTNSGGSTLKSFQLTPALERPNNTTAYVANTVVADVSGAVLSFANVAKANGTGVKIVRVRIQTNDTNVSGKKFNVHLYKEVPAPIANATAFVIDYAAVKPIGTVPVVMGVGNLGKVGQNDFNQIICNPTARNIFVVLESVDGFTPTLGSTKFTIEIDCELSNN